MTTRECDTYTVWSPTSRTITARCSCGWAAPTRPQTEIIEAAQDEMDHLWEALFATFATDRKTDPDE
jgi:hypothetical protein